MMFSSPIIDKLRQLGAISGPLDFRKSTLRTKFRTVSQETVSGSILNKGLRTWARGRSAVSKTMLDFAGSAALLVVIASVFARITIALLRSRDGIFFAHQRVSRDGETFPWLKFRTMVPVAARGWEETRKLRNDPRITWLGRFLRSTSLDELPQLVNVLRGNMSLVGPCPVTRSELETYYGDDARAYMSVRPGLTGLWQISGRSSTDYSERVKMDVAYVRTLSLRGDLWILLATPVAVFMRRGAF
jgi:exopolysaccharide production protein ExoY